MGKTLKFLIAFVIGFLIFIFAMKKVGWARIAESIFFFFSLRGLLIIALTFLVAAISVFRWKFILRSQGIKAPLITLGGLWSVGFVVSFFTPVALFGGEALRIFLMKKEISAGIEKSAASVIIDKILDTTLFLTFLSVGLLVFAFYGDFPSKVFSWVMWLALGGLFWLLWFFYFRALRKKSVLEWFLDRFGFKKERVRSSKNGKLIFKAEREIINFFSIKSKAFWQGIGLSVLKYGLSIARAAFLIFFLEKKFAVSKILAVYGFTNLAFLAPLPASLGSLEGAGIFSFGALGLNLANGAIFALLWRAADILICLVGIIFLIKFRARLAEIKILDFISKLKN